MLIQGGAGSTAELDSPCSEPYTQPVKRQKDEGNPSEISNEPPELFPAAPTVTKAAQNRGSKRQRSPARPSFHPQPTAEALRLAGSGGRLAPGRARANPRRALRFASVCRERPRGAPAVPGRSVPGGPALQTPSAGRLRSARGCSAEPAFLHLRGTGNETGTRRRVTVTAAPRPSGPTPEQRASPGRVGSTHLDGEGPSWPPPRGGAAGAWAAGRSRVSAAPPTPEKMSAEAAGLCCAPSLPPPEQSSAAQSGRSRQRPLAAESGARRAGGLTARPSVCPSVRPSGWNARPGLREGNGALRSRCPAVAAGGTAPWLEQATSEHSVNVRVPLPLPQTHP